MVFICWKLPWFKGGWQHDNILKFSLKIYSFSALVLGHQFSLSLFCMPFDSQIVTFLPLTSGRIKWFNVNGTNLTYPSLVSIFCWPPAPSPLLFLSSKHTILHALGILIAFLLVSFILSPFDIVCRRLLYPWFPYNVCWECPESKFLGLFPYSNIFFFGMRQK